jgi:hypothetical protein
MHCALPPAAAIAPTTSFGASVRPTSVTAQLREPSTLPAEAPMALPAPVMMVTFMASPGPALTTRR